jgi:ubiquinone/menaquinone biosynthesis C-methylase UbiE
MSKIFENKKVAAGYNSARALPEETKTLWMNVISGLVPPQNISRVLDLGGGTGRFSGMLHQIYRCPIITADPSEEMLRQGVLGKYEGINWIISTAENIPLKTDSLNLVFMSNVYHHLEEPETAFGEIHRVLKDTGNLIIRNGTQDSDTEAAWMSFFPEAIEYDKGKIPYRVDLIESLVRYGFQFIRHQIVNQLFASSYSEYYEKISGRGLSPLIAISDESFEAGLKRFRMWIDAQPQNQPVYEPIDIFLFQ